MGYISRVTGRITVHPPVTITSDNTKSRFLPDNAPPSGTATSQIPNVVFVVEERPVDGYPGAFQRAVVGIEGRPADEFSYYDLEEHLEDAVRWVIYAGSEVSGRLVRIGSDQGDVARYRVANDDTVPIEVERAALRWPDGSPVTEAAR